MKAVKWGFIANCCFIKWASNLVEKCLKSQFCFLQSKPFLLNLTSVQLITECPLQRTGKFDGFVRLGHPGSWKCSRSSFVSKNISVKGRTGQNETVRLYDKYDTTHKHKIIVTVNGCNIFIAILIRFANQWEVTCSACSLASKWTFSEPKTPVCVLTWSRLPM